MAQDFHTGDVVQLKSGGPHMTITDKSDEVIRCCWFNDLNQQRQTDTFIPEALTLISGNNNAESQTDTVGQPKKSVQDVLDEHNQQVTQATSEARSALAERITAVSTELTHLTRQAQGLKMTVNVHTARYGWQEIAVFGLSLGVPL